VPLLLHSSCVRVTARSMGDQARLSSVPSGLAKRARMILLAADGTPNAEATRVTGLSRATMIAWRWGSRPGRPLPGLRTGLLVRDRGQGVAEMGDPAPPAGEIQVQHRPGAGGETPRRRGPVPGPPANAAVVSVDDKSQIPALDRTAPILPLRPACPSGAPTTARTTAPRPCLPPSRSPPGRSPHTPATPGTATRSASTSSRRSPPPIPGWTCTSCWTTTAPTSTPRSASGSPCRRTRDHLALHPIPAARG
jgi:hypothetical protein